MLGIRMTLIFSRDQAIVTFFLSVNDDWAWDKPQLRLNLVKTYFNSVLANGGCSLDMVDIPSRLFVRECRNGCRFATWDEQNKESILSVLIEHVLGFQAVRDCLFHSSQIWTIEDLKLRSRWYVGILAHTDEKFHATLLQYCSSYRSPFKNSYLATSDKMIKSIFSVRKIVEEVSFAPLRDRTIFLQTIIREGTPQMLDPFLRAGIDLDEGHILENYLGTAVSSGKLPAAISLLDAGASAARALSMLCDWSGNHSQHFEPMFLMLIDCLADTNGNITEDDCPDPVVAVLRCKRAIEIRPDSVELLLKSGWFISSRLYGSQKTLEVQSYVVNAIFFDRPDSVRTLLAYGVSTESDIQDMFGSVSMGSAGSYTWLTLAIEFGKTACVKALVEYSDNTKGLVRRRDKGGRCAIDFAQSFAIGPHPRVPSMYGVRWMEGYIVGNKDINTEISFSEDTAIYDILKAVLDDDPIAEPLPVNASPNKSALLETYSNLDSPFHSSLYEAIFVGTCYIGMYGMLIIHTLLQFAILLATQGHMFRFSLFWSVIILLTLAFSYYLL